MANFKVKNGLQAGRYLLSGGTETAGSVGYSIAGAAYDSKSFSVTSESTLPEEIRFKPDGTKVFVLDVADNEVLQYSLSTAWDVSTASYDSKSFSVASQELNPQGLEFNSDGTKMYVCGQTDAVYQYTLSTAWDVSTASYDSVSFSTASQITGVPWSMSFSDGGAKLYVVGSTPDTIFQYSLSTAYDLSTASYSSKSFSVGTEATSPTGIKVSSDGTTVFVVDNSSDSVYKYTLSTAYDISTASYSSESFDLSSQEAQPYGVDIKPDGTKMYIIGFSADAVLQYSTALLTQTLDLSTGTTFSFTPSGATTVSFTNPPASGKAIGFSVEIVGDGSAITWPSSVKWPAGVAPTATASKELYTFVTTDGGTTYYGKKAGGDIA